MKWTHMAALGLVAALLPAGIAKAEDGLVASRGPGPPAWT